MYVNNTAKKDIKLSSFDGFIFMIPTGTSWIWDKAGEHLLTNIYKVESEGGTDKYGYSNGHGIPALLQSTEKIWEKEGRKLTQVERFRISDKLVPRAKLITIAKQRGVEDAKIMEYLSDPNVDATEIVNTINDLPVPESVKHPLNLLEKPELANVV